MVREKEPTTTNLWRKSQSPAPRCWKNKSKVFMELNLFEMISKISMFDPDMYWSLLMASQANSENSAMNNCDLAPTLVMQCLDFLLDFLYLEIYWNSAIRLPFLFPWLITASVASTWQVESQPSSSARFPSSQALPQRGRDLRSNGTSATQI